MAGNSILGLLIALVIAAAGFSVYSYERKLDAKNTGFISSNLNVTPTSTQTIYMNSSYRYAFKYDSRKLSIMASGANSFDQPINNTTSGVSVFPVGGSAEDPIFSVQYLDNIARLTIGTITSEYSGVLNANKLVIVPQLIAGSNGYKVTVPTDSRFSESSYFVNNTVGKTLRVDVANNNSAAQVMFDSFHLN